MALTRAVACIQASVLAVGLWLASLQAASAESACAPASQPGIERCVSGLSAAALTRIFQPQQESNWCWAASVTMILRRYGVAVPQDEVVRAALGVPENQRASARAIASLLNRAWHDASGNAVAASAQMLAPWRQAQGVSAPEVIDDLVQGRPLLLGAQQHAMVLVQVTYERRIDGNALTPAGVRLLRALVLDPASGQWLRNLQPNERQPDFLARVAVDVRAPSHTLALARADSLQ